MLWSNRAGMCPCACVGGCGRLFELFDLNGSGSLSIQELIAGLSALCIGTPVDKARIVFDQYDTNGERVGGWCGLCVCGWRVEWRSHRRRALTLD